jgi:hypothetical protein
MPLVLRRARDGRASAGTPDDYDVLDGATLDEAKGAFAATSREWLRLARVPENPRVADLIELRQGMVPPDGLRLAAAGLCVKQSWPGPCK